MTEPTSLFPFLPKSILLIKCLNFVLSDAAARPCSYLVNVDVEIRKRVREIVYDLGTNFDEPALIQIMLAEDGHVDIMRRETLSLRMVLDLKMERGLVTWERKIIQKNIRAHILKEIVSGEYE